MTKRISPRKEKDITRKDLLRELRKMLSTYFRKVNLSLSKELHSLKIDKRLDKIDTRLELALGTVDDIRDLVKVQNARIKELESKWKS